MRGRRRGERGGGVRRGEEAKGERQEEVGGVRGRRKSCRDS